MKKLYTFYFTAIVGLLFFSVGCHEAPIGDAFADTNYGAKGAVVSAANVVNGFFDIVAPDESMIAFDLVSEGEAVSNVTVNVSYEGGGEVSVGSASVPGNLSVTMNQLLGLIGVGAGDITVGESVTFSFDATTASGTFRSSDPLVVPFSCSSNIGGTYDYVSTNFSAITGACPTDPTTGQVTWEDLGGGTYLSSDLGFGQYGTTCWNDSPATSGDATLSDVCNKLISGGLDQYGLAYEYSITNVSGGDLSISWFNNYDDSGDVVLTRTDGKDWPALFTE